MAFHSTKIMAGQAVYITNPHYQYAWPALAGQVVSGEDGDWVQLIFGSGETALIRTDCVRPYPEITTHTFDFTITPCPEAFFDASHHNNLAATSTSKTQFQQETLQDLGTSSISQATLNVEQQLKAAEEDAAMEEISLTDKETPASTKLIMQPHQKKWKEQQNSKRKRLSSKMSLRGRYRHPIGAPADSTCCTIL